MVSIQSIREQIEQGADIDEIIELCNNLYDLTDFVNEDYPRHKSWFYQKQLPETLSGRGRDIIYATDENKNYMGVVFIKKDEIEKKICTLFVDEKFRRLGVGTKLIEKAMQVLGTTTPVITIADYKLPMFENLIKKYKWKQTEVVKGLYNDKHAELVYNGYLSGGKSR